jgi:polyferredoxin
VTDDQFWRIVLNAGALAAIGAFSVPIMRFLRRIGFRKEREVDSTDPRRLIWIFAVIFGLLFLMSLVDSATKAFK